MLVSGVVSDLHRADLLEAIVLLVIYHVVLKVLVAQVAGGRLG